MISNNTSTCQDCGGKLKYYDKVRRIVRTKGRVSKWVNVPNADVYIGISQIIFTHTSNTNRK